MASCGFIAFLTYLPCIFNEYTLQSGKCEDRKVYGKYISIATTIGSTSQYIKN